jgi:hypothetical protein
MSRITRNQAEALMLGALAIVGILVWRSIQSYELLESKASAQQREVSAIVDYARRHQVLKSVESRFNDSFASEAQFSDWASYFTFMNFRAASLEVDVDKLSLQFSDFSSGDYDGIGLNRACVGSDQGADLVVRAAKYSTLMQGIEKLLSRPDIMADSVTIIGDRGAPEARLGRFCLLFRKSTSGS